MLDPLKLNDFVTARWRKETLESLIDYIKIPNKSPHFDDNWQANGFMEQAIQHIAGWCNAQPIAGMVLDIVRLPNRTPLLFIEVAGNIDDTVLLYGHLDKQPEMAGWDHGLGPWTPVIHDNCLYGRGGADDGYAIYASLTAIAALQAQGLSHARYVIIIEACEESGSYDLPYYIEHLVAKIGQPSLVVCLDSGAGNYEQLWMTTSLRGNIVGELSVTMLTEGVHSGNASGIVADTFRITKQLISRIEDEQTGDIKLATLFCDIPDERQHQAAACAHALGANIYNSFPWVLGGLPITRNKTTLVLNRTWRPALAVTGIAGMPAIADAGNVLRPTTRLKLSMRLPPLVCPNEAAHALQHALTNKPPYQAQVRFTIHNAAKGWHAPSMANWLAKAVNEASMTFYQKPVVYMGEGGTIPFMGMLGARFPDAQFMITGVLGPRSNAHGPNEFLHLGMVEKITACVAYVLNSHAINKSLDNSRQVNEYLTQ